MIPKLDDFIAQALTKFWPANSYVKESGFASLYVRVAKRHINGKLQTTIDLANMTASKPGNGAFTKLVERLRAQYGLIIYVECVLNPRLAAKLVRMGFVQHTQHDPSSYYLLPEKEWFMMKDPVAYEFLQCEGFCGACDHESETLEEYKAHQATGHAAAHDPEDAFDVSGNE